MAASFRDTVLNSSMRSYARCVICDTVDFNLLRRDYIICNSNEDNTCSHGVVNVNDQMV